MADRSTAFVIFTPVIITFATSLLNVSPKNSEAVVSASFYLGHDPAFDNGLYPFLLNGLQDLVCNGFMSKTLPRHISYIIYKKPFFQKKNLACGLGSGFDNSTCVFLCNQIWNTYIDVS